MENDKLGRFWDTVYTCTIWTHLMKYTLASSK